MATILKPPPVLDDGMTLAEERATSNFLKAVQDRGGNVCIRGIQNSGKTALMVLFDDRLIAHFGYEWHETTGNLHMWDVKPIYRDPVRGILVHGTPPPKAEIVREGIPTPGYTYRDNQHLREYIRKVYRKSKGLYRHKIIQGDEIDQVYSHLDSMIDTEARNDLLSLWQDKKMENYFVYTKHIGPGCNKLIRTATEVSIRAYFDRRFDTIYGVVIDGFDMRVKLLTFRHASRIFPHYDRWEYIF